MYEFLKAMQRGYGPAGMPQVEATPRSTFTVPPMAWPVENGRRDGRYFYQPEIVTAQAARVQVARRGDMLMLGSYSYLGLIGHPAITRAAVAAVGRYGTGTHGVRLLAGTLPLHNELERAIAAFKGCESAVVFSSGFLANLSVITALVGRGDLVFCDRLDHASIIDGCRLSGATVVRVNHNDMDDLAAKLACADPARNKLVVADAVFSMDGDIFNLPEASRICRRHGALLMLDEAHSLGVLGRTGAGIEEHFGLGPDAYDIKMGTFSKAIPSCGGYVAASARIIDVVKHNGRGFIYSASQPPAQAAAALKSLEVLRAEPWRVEKLRTNTGTFIALLEQQGLRIAAGGTPIVPVICGSDDTAFTVAKACHDRGVFVQAIPSPVVPSGSARLRCCVTTDHCGDELARGAEVVGQACRLHGAIAVDQQESAPDLREHRDA